jgi:DNA-binding CsgD family transcriptional regulator
VLPIWGEPGIGKTSLLEFAVASASEMIVLEGRGVESELELPYGQLAQLLRPLRERFDALASSQSRLLEAVIGEGVPDGLDKDRLSVSMATFSLLNMVAVSSPVLIVLDDVQWVDEATIDTLAFVARRVRAEGIVLLLASREDDALRGFDQTETLRVEGLDPDAAVELLAHMGVGKMSRAESSFLIQATSGNPLALIDLPRLLSQQELKGLQPLVDPIPIGDRLFDAYERGIRALPERCRQALLIASVIDNGDVPTLIAALERAGLTVEDLESATEAGFVAFGSEGMQFRHPLLRSAVTQSAPPQEYRRAHQLVAEAMTERGGSEDKSRRVWHLATATITAHPVVAQLLEEEGLRATDLTGFASSSYAFERAAQLSTDATDRDRRFFAAAHAAFVAGRITRALTLVDKVMMAGPDTQLHLDALRLHCRIRALLGQPRQAIDALLGAAASLGDPLLSAQVMLDTIFPFAMIGDTEGLLAMARRAAELAQGRDPATELITRVVLGMAHLMRGESTDGLALVDVDELLVDLSKANPELMVLVALLGHCRIAVEMFGEADQLFTAMEESARTRGALSVMPHVLLGRAMLDFFRGNWPQALSAAQQAAELSRDSDMGTNQARETMVLMRIAAGMGDAEFCETYGVEAAEQTVANGEEMLEAQYDFALGLLKIGRAEWDGAVASLEKARCLFEQRGALELGYYQWAPDLVEAYVHTGQVAEAEPVAELVHWHAQRTGRPIIWAFAERCRGLIAVNGDYNAAFLDALRWHDSAERPFEEARTQLCYGERLRREKKKAAARTQLQNSLTTFARLGAKSFAERARQELVATGLELMPPTGRPTDLLTPRELQVALALSKGATTREAAASLFVSPKTIEYHLAHVYQKLGLASRRDLRRALEVTDEG